ncbi:MAG: hypothetical protein QXS66_06990 [Thermoproteota archaeon]|nr:hypothetical protein [Candidatus Brockarchaeota archaeon]
MHYVENVDWEKSVSRGHYDAPFKHRVLIHLPLSANVSQNHFPKIAAENQNNYRQHFAASSRQVLDFTQVEGSRWLYTFEKDMFTSYVFEVWKMGDKLVSTSPTYGFTVTKPVNLTTSWRTETNITAVRAIAGVILILILKRRRTSSVH